MTDEYAIKWQIADRAAQQEYQRALAMGYPRMEALRRHMETYNEIMGIAK